MFTTIKYPLHKIFGLAQYGDHKQKNQKKECVQAPVAENTSASANTKKSNENKRTNVSGANKRRAAEKSGIMQKVISSGIQENSENNDIIDSNNNLSRQEEEQKENNKKGDIETEEAHTIRVAKYFEKPMQFLRKKISFGAIVSTEMVFASGHESDDMGLNEKTLSNTNLTRVGTDICSKSIVEGGDQVDQGSTKSDEKEFVFIDKKVCEDTSKWEKNSIPAKEKANELIINEINRNTQNLNEKNRDAAYKELKDILENWMNDVNIIESGYCDVSRRDSKKDRDVKLYYEIHGTGPKKLFFVMGVMGLVEYWIMLSKYFGKKEEYQICVFENRGSGRSSLKAGPYTVVQLAKDALKLLDHIGWKENVHLIGISLGGMILQQMCLLAKAESRKYESVIFMNTYQTIIGSTLTKGEMMLTLKGFLLVTGNIEPILDIAFTKKWLNSSFDYKSNKIMLDTVKNKEIKQYTNKKVLKAVFELSAERASHKKCVDGEVSVSEAGNSKELKNENNGFISKEDGGGSKNIHTEQDSKEVDGDLGIGGIRGVDNDNDGDGDFDENSQEEHDDETSANESDELSDSESVNPNLKGKDDSALADMKRQKYGNSSDEKHTQRAYFSDNDYRLRGSDKSSNVFINRRSRLARMQTESPVKRTDIQKKTMLEHWKTHTGDINQLAAALGHNISTRDIKELILGVYEEENNAKKLQDLIKVWGTKKSEESRERAEKGMGEKRKHNQKFVLGVSSCEQLKRVGKEGKERKEGKEGKERKEGKEGKEGKEEKCEEKKERRVSKERRRSIRKRRNVVAKRFVVIHGSKDQVVKVGKGRELAKSFECPFFEIEGAGHMGYIQAPLSYISCIESAINDEMWIKMVTKKKSKQKGVGQSKKIKVVIKTGNEYQEPKMLSSQSEVPRGIGRRSLTNVENGNNQSGNVTSNSTKSNIGNGNTVNKNDKQGKRPILTTYCSNMNHYFINNKTYKKNIQKGLQKTQTEPPGSLLMVSTTKTTTATTTEPTPSPSPTPLSSPTRIYLQSRFQQQPNENPKLEFLRSPFGRSFANAREESVQYYRSESLGLNVDYNIRCG